MYNSYSVLMSVYYRDNPEFLKEAMLSIYNQTEKTDDFVVICDGPVTVQIDNILIQMQEKFGSVLNVIRLPENQGLGLALNEGLKHCKNILVARMDSDDISIPSRCKQQLEKFNKNPNLSIIGSSVYEFSKSLENPDNIRVLPLSHNDILTFAKSRSPFNHPSVMYKKQSIIDVGSYQDFYLLEDYHLWIRLLNKGYISENIKDPLLFMRAGEGQYKRRGGMKYAKSQVRLAKYMYDISFISLPRMIFNIVVRFSVAIVPSSIRSVFYKLFLRKKA